MQEGLDKVDSKTNSVSFEKNNQRDDQTVHISVAPPSDGESNGSDADVSNDDQADGTTSLGVDQGKKKQRKRGIAGFRRAVEARRKMSKVIKIF